jgi:hypothetical protein
MMTLFQLREAIDRLVTKAAHLGNMPVRVNLKQRLDVEAVVVEGVEVLVVVNENPKTLMEPEHRIHQAHPEEVPEADPVVLAKD